MLQPPGRAGPDFSRTSQLIMVSHSVKQGELRQFTPSLLSRSFKASSSCEGHFHPSCCKPTNVIIESHGFHATRFLPATKVAEGRNWGAGGGGWRMCCPGPLCLAKSGATSSSGTGSRGFSCPQPSAGFVLPSTLSSSVPSARECTPTKAETMFPSSVPSSITSRVQ